MVAPCTPTWDQTLSLGTCPYWELNQGPFGEWSDAQPFEPLRPGLNKCPFHGVFSVLFFGFGVCFFVGGDDLAK